MIAVLAGKELRRLFASPLAWVMLAFLQVLFAFFFLLGLQAFFDTAGADGDDAGRADAGLHRATSSSRRSASRAFCC